MKRRLTKEQKEFFKKFLFNHDSFIDIYSLKPLNFSFSGNNLNKENWPKLKETILNVDKYADEVLTIYEKV